MLTPWAVVSESVPGYVSVPGYLRGHSEIPQNDLPLWQLCRVKAALRERMFAYFNHVSETQVLQLGKLVGAGFLQVSTISCAF